MLEWILVAGKKDVSSVKPSCYCVFLNPVASYCDLKDVSRKGEFP